MQAERFVIVTGPYTDGMKTGRPAKTARCDFGARLHAMREEAGLSQQQVAEQLGISQPAYASWERRDVAIQPVQLAKLAEIFAVSVEDLVYNGKRPARRGGPAGKARQVFEEVSGMPRTQQKKILDVVEALVAQARVAQ